MKHVVVVGGGISGLAAAHRLLELGGGEVAITVLEASDRLGGALGTELVDGFVVERGADGFLVEKRSAIELAGRLGLTDRLVRTRPARDGAYVVREGRLHPIPEGFSMMAPTRIRPFLRSPVVSMAGKLRALAEIAVPQGPLVPDESLGSFVRRRFGQEVLERLAQPLVSGIYGADPEVLSLRSTMPRFLDEERRSGSVLLGLRKRAAQSKENAQGARYGLFAAFDLGMQVLVDALAASLAGHTVRLSQAVSSIERAPGGGFDVRTNGEVLHADALVLAIPGPSASRLTTGLAPALASALDGVGHGSCATVVLGYPGRVLPPNIDGYGFVVPAIEQRPSLAATFLSRKWPGRAPEARDLIRVFVGGAHAPSLPSASNEALVAVAREELRALLGVTAQPSLVRVRKWEAAMPQYHVGHQSLAARVDAAVAETPGLFLAGNSVHGVGIPDAIASGERAAAGARDHLARA